MVEAPFEPFLAEFDIIIVIVLPAQEMFKIADEVGDILLELFGFLLVGGRVEHDRHDHRAKVADEEVVAVASVDDVVAGIQIVFEIIRDQFKVALCRQPVLEDGKVSVQVVIKFFLAQFLLRLERVFGGLERGLRDVQQVVGVMVTNTRDHRGQERGRVADHHIVARTGVDSVVANKQIVQVRVDDISLARLDAARVVGDGIAHQRLDHLQMGLFDHVDKVERRVFEVAQEAVIAQRGGGEVCFRHRQAHHERHRDQRVVSHDGVIAVAAHNGVVAAAQVMRIRNALDGALDQLVIQRQFVQRVECAEQASLDIFGRRLDFFQPGVKRRSDRGVVSENQIGSGTAVQRVVARQHVHVMNDVRHKGEERHEGRAVRPDQSIIGRYPAQDWHHVRHGGELGCQGREFQRLQRHIRHDHRAAPR